jgi:hypothetical protein
MTGTAIRAERGSAMKHRYLEVTYRKGRPVAAYYDLPRCGSDRSVRTEVARDGLLIDYAADGRAIGIEISTPSRLDLASLNDVLAGVGQAPADRDDLAPLLAA